MTKKERQDLVRELKATVKEQRQDIEELGSRSERLARWNRQLIEAINRTGDILGLPAVAPIDLVSAIEPYERDVTLSIRLLNEKLAAAQAAYAKLEDDTVPKALLAAANEQIRKHFDNANTGRQNHRVIREALYERVKTLEGHLLRRDEEHDVMSDRLRTAKGLLLRCAEGLALTSDQQTATADPRLDDVLRQLAAVEAEFKSSAADKAAK